MWSQELPRVDALVLDTDLAVIIHQNHAPWFHICGETWILLGAALSAGVSHRITHQIGEVDCELQEHEGTKEHHRVHPWIRFESFDDLHREYGLLQ